MFSELSHKKTNQAHLGPILGKKDALVKHGQTELVDFLEEDRIKAKLFAGRLLANQVGGIVFR